MQLRDQTTAGALLGLAVILLALALVVLSQTLGLILVVIAGVISLASLAAGNRTQRIAGAMLVAASIFIAIFAFESEVDPATSDYAAYVGRAKVSAALGYANKAEAALSAACSEGTYDAKQSVKDLGLADSDPASYILRAELRRIAADTTQLRLTLTDVAGLWFFGWVRWVIIPQGRFIDIAYTCTPGKQLTSRPVSATVPSRFLPGRLRL